MKALLLAVLAPFPLLANDAGSCLDLGATERSGYVISDGDDHTMCGDVSDVVIADGSRSKGEEVVWFRIDDATWVIRDSAVIAEARRLFTEVNEIGRQQGVIGAKQGRIGAEQARIGMKQATAALRNESSEDDSARMSELGHQQSRLGEQQSALGERMKVQIAAAQHGLSLLLDRAMKDGTAVRVIRL